MTSTATPDWYSAQVGDYGNLCKHRRKEPSTLQQKHYSLLCFSLKLPSHFRKWLFKSSSFSWSPLQLLLSSNDLLSYFLETKMVLENRKCFKEKHLKNRNHQAAPPLTFPATRSTNLSATESFFFFPSIKGINLHIKEQSSHFVLLCSHSHLLVTMFSVLSPHCIINLTSSSPFINTDTILLISYSFVPLNCNTVPFVCFPFITTHLQIFVNAHQFHFCPAPLHYLNLKFNQYNLCVKFK